MNHELKSDHPFSLLKNDNPELAAKNEEIWETVLTHLKGELSSTSINIWLKDVYILKIDGKKVFLYIEDNYQKETIISQYTSAVKSALSLILNYEPELVFLSASDSLSAFDMDFLKGQGPKSTISPLISATAPQAGTSSFYTFDNFIVGNSNRFAHAASEAVANQPAQSYNPLFLHGGSGLGKTHLLYAIMNRLKEKHPDFKIILISGEEFTNEIIETIRQGRGIEFRSKYRYADLFLVDDVQFIAGRESTQEEFFHTFNTLYEAKKQIVMTSDRPPKDIATLDERLQTRFEMGLLADIQPPDVETRMAIIERKACEIGVTLSPDVISYISNNVKTNVRQLEGAVKKLKAYHQLINTPITLDVAKEAIRDILSENEFKVISPERVIEVVSSFYGVDVDDITGKKRTSEIVLPRQIAMYITREITELSLPAIGKAFGGRDHTTVLYSIQKIEQDMAKSIRTKQIIYDLIKNLKEG